MPPIEDFMKSLDIMREVHIRKNEDYSSSTVPFENFERQALIQSWFKHDIDKAFAGLIALKLARLATLLNKEGAPNNESIEDTFIDMANYTLLWKAKRKDSFPMKRPDYGYISVGPPPLVSEQEHFLPCTKHGKSYCSECNNCDQCGLINQRPS